MGWKFWQSNNDKDPSKVKLPKPTDIPERVGRHLVVNKGMDPDSVWHLKCVLKPTPEGQSVFEFRIYGDNAVHNAGVKVVNYESLDAHPELVMFHGRLDKKSDRMEVHKGA
ncbi:MAG: hypothetical protein ACOWWM_11030 [Desulfobacterales bacterium]